MRLRRGRRKGDAVRSPGERRDTRAQGASPSVAARATRETVRQKLFAYLLERPGGATPRELLKLILHAAGGRPEFGPRFIQTLLAPEPALCGAPATAVGRSGCTTSWRNRWPDCTFVVVDLETTGRGASAPAITRSARPASPAAAWSRSFSSW